MAENTDIKLTVEAWAEIVMERWLDKIDRLGIGYSMQLADSFQMEVISNAGGDVARIEFAFKYYGKFVDMGVGKYTKLDQVKELKTDRRMEGKQRGLRGLAGWRSSGGSARQRRRNPAGTAQRTRIQHIISRALAQWNHALHPCPVRRAAGYRQCQETYQMPPAHQTALDRNLHFTSIGPLPTSLVTVRFECFSCK